MSGLLRNISPAQWVVGLLFGVLGQILNISIYTAIGHDGVYYGTKLGKTIPWCTTFPFTKVFGLFRIAHPQYIGSVLSIWGLVTLVYMSVNPGIFTVALGWSVFYAITGVIEEYY